MRLRLLEPFIRTWPQALGILALPQNVPVAVGSLAKMCDDLWHAVGDKSVDVRVFNFGKNLPFIVVYTDTNYSWDGKMVIYNIYLYLYLYLWYSSTGTQRGSHWLGFTHPQNCLCYKTPHQTIKTPTSFWNLGSVMWPSLGNFVQM